LLGSVTQEVVLDSPRPVVVVPPRAQHLQGKEIQLRRVLVPVDGSAASLSVVELLLSWPEARQLESVLMRAVRPEATGGYLMPPSPPGHAGQSHVHATAVNAERELAAVAERVGGRARRVDVRVVESAQAGDVITAAVRQELVDFIAMSTRGMTGLRRVVLGSVAEQVVRASEIPVLLVTR
jgi:nucleotide-binding universal stress UspA family protein